MKKALVSFTIFAIVTIVLTWFWGEWGRMGYGRFLKAVAPPIYDAIGFGDARVGAFRQRYINFVPFVGLVLATPGLELRRRLGGLCLGIIALFVGHLALNLTELMGKGRHLPFVPSILSDTLPFLAWVVVAYPALAQWLPRLAVAGEGTGGKTAENADTHVTGEPESDPET